MRQKLTPAFVKSAALPTSGDRIVYWDTALPSFGLVVTKSGARSFVYQYRNALQQSRRATWAVRLDGNSGGLTLEQARSEARKVAGESSTGLTRSNRPGRNAGRQRKRSARPRLRLPPR